MIGTDYPHFRRISKFRRIIRYRRIFTRKSWNEIVQSDGSTIVLTASPGAGKSTYLSYLVRELQYNDWPVVRHHYALQNPITPFERFDSIRVAESLMADMEDELPEYLGDLTSNNPDP